MTSKKVVEVLKKGGCGILVSSDHELALVLNACDDSGVTFWSGRKASNWKRDQNPLVIFINNKRITLLDCYNDDWTLFSEDEKNITEWFFEEVNGDDI